MLKPIDKLSFGKARLVFETDEGYIDAVVSVDPGGVPVSPGAWVLDSFTPGGTGPFVFTHSRNGGALLVFGDGALQSSGYSADNDSMNFTYDTGVFTTLAAAYTY